MFSVLNLRKLRLLLYWGIHSLEIIMYFNNIVSRIKTYLAVPANRVALVKNIIVVVGACTIGMLISPAKAIGVLVTKVPCLDHDNCIVTTVQEFDI